MEDDIYVLSVGCMRQSLLVNQRCKHNFGLSTVCQFEEDFLFKQQLILALWNKFKDFKWKLFIINKQCVIVYVAQIFFPPVGNFRPLRLASGSV